MKSLREDVRTRLRSMTTISSLQQAVEELVLNSLDANSSVIKVSIDHQLYKIQVDDNGCGISWADLKVLGTRHVTSKSRDTTPCFGHRGETIASLVQVSGSMEIKTRPSQFPTGPQDELGSFRLRLDHDAQCHLPRQRGELALDSNIESGNELSHAECHNTFAKHFYQGTMKEVALATEERSGVGTSVILHNFFYCFPIRRKIMREAIDLENIKDWLEGMAVVHPEVSFSLKKDCGDASYLLQTKSCSSIIARIEELYGRELRESLCEVHQRIKDIYIRGFISAKPSLSKRFQFLYVNKLLVRKTSLHKFLNKLMDRTVFSSSCSEILPFRNLSSSKSPGSPTKSAKIYGIFFLEIECPTKDCSVATETNKTFVEFRDTDKVLQCLEGAVQSFCKAQDIRVSTRDISNCKSRGTNDTNVEPKFQASSGCTEDLHAHEEEFNPAKDVESLVRSRTREKLNAFRRKAERDHSAGVGPPAHRYGRLVGLWDVRSAVQSGCVKRPRKGRDARFPPRDDMMETEQNNNGDNKSNTCQLFQAGSDEENSDGGKQEDAGSCLGHASDVETSTLKDAKDPRHISHINLHNHTNRSVSSLFSADVKVHSGGVVQQVDVSDCSPDSDCRALSTCVESSNKSSLQAFKKVINESLLPLPNLITNRNKIQQSKNEAEFKRKICDSIYGRSFENNKRLKNEKGSSSELDLDASDSARTPCARKSELLVRINSFGSSVNNSKRPVHDLSSSDESSDDGGCGEGNSRVVSCVALRDEVERSGDRPAGVQAAAAATESASKPCKNSSSIQEFRELIGLHPGKSGTKFSDTIVQQSSSPNSRCEIVSKRRIAEPSKTSLSGDGPTEYRVEGPREVSSRTSAKVQEVPMPSSSSARTPVAVPRRKSKPKKKRQFISGSPSNKSRAKVVDVKLPLKNIRTCSSLGSSLRLKRKQELAKIQERNFFCQFRRISSNKKYCGELPEASAEFPLTSNANEHFNFNPLIIPSRPAVVSRVDVRPHRGLPSSEHGVGTRGSFDHVCQALPCCSFQNSLQTASKSEEMCNSECGVHCDQENLRRKRNPLDVSPTAGDIDAATQPSISASALPVASAGDVMPSLSRDGIECHSITPVSHTALSRALTHRLTSCAACGSTAVTDSKISIKYKESGVTSGVNSIPVCSSSAPRNESLLSDVEISHLAPGTAVFKPTSSENTFESVTEVGETSDELLAASSSPLLEAKVDPCLVKLDPLVPHDLRAVQSTKNFANSTTRKVAMAAACALHTSTASVLLPCGPEHSVSCELDGQVAGGLDVRTAVTSSSLAPHASPVDVLTYNSHPSYSVAHENVSRPCVSGGALASASPYFRSDSPKVYDSDRVTTQNSRKSGEKMVCATAALKELPFTQASVSSSKACSYTGRHDSPDDDAGNSAENSYWKSACVGTAASVETKTNISYESAQIIRPRSSDAGRDACTTLATPCITLEFTPFYTLLDLNLRVSSLNEESHQSANELRQKCFVLDQNVSQGSGDGELVAEPRTEDTSVRGERFYRDDGTGVVVLPRPDLLLLPVLGASNSLCASSVATTDTITSATIASATSTISTTSSTISTTTFTISTTTSTISTTTSTIPTTSTTFPTITSTTVPTITSTTVPTITSTTVPTITSTTVPTITSATVPTITSTTVPTITSTTVPTITSTTVPTITSTTIPTITSTTIPTITSTTIPTTTSTTIPTTIIASTTFNTSTIASTTFTTSTTTTINTTASTITSTSTDITSTTDTSTYFTFTCGTSTVNTSTATTVAPAISKQFLNVDSDDAACPASPVCASTSMPVSLVTSHENNATNSWNIGAVPPAPHGKTCRINHDKLATQVCRPELEVERSLQDGGSSSDDSLWLTQLTRKSLSPVPDVSNGHSFVPLDDDALVSLKSHSSTAPSKKTCEFFSRRLRVKANKSEFKGQFSQIKRSESFNDELSVIGASSNFGLLNDLSPSTGMSPPTNRAGPLSSRLSAALRESAHKPTQSEASFVVAGNSMFPKGQYESIGTQKPSCAVNTIGNVPSPSAVINAEPQGGGSSSSGPPALCDRPPPLRLAGKLASIVSSEKTSTSLLSEGTNTTSDASRAGDAAAHVAADNQQASVTSDPSSSSEKTPSHGGVTISSKTSSSVNLLMTSGLFELTRDDESTRVRAASSAAVPVEQLGEWNQVTNEAGDTFYVHRRSGNSSYSAPFVTAPSSEGCGSCALSSASVQLIPITAEPNSVTQDGFTKCSYFPVSRHFGNIPEKRFSFPNKAINQGSHDGDLQIQLEDLSTKSSDSLSVKISRTLEKHLEVHLQEAANSPAPAVSNDLSFLNKEIFPGANKLLDSIAVDSTNEHHKPIGGAVKSLDDREVSRETICLPSGQLAPEMRVRSMSTSQPDDELNPTRTLSAEGKPSPVAASKASEATALSRPLRLNAAREERGCQPAEAAVKSLCAAAPNSGLQASILRLPRSPEDGEDVMLWPAHQPCKFTKDLFATCKVLGQLDQKFILCVVDTPAGDLRPDSTAGPPPESLQPQSAEGHTAGKCKISGNEGNLGAESRVSNIPPRSKMLVAFDQHAVHERVRLEALLADNLVSGAGDDSDAQRTDHKKDQLSSKVDESFTQRVKKAEISPAVSISFPPSDVRIMRAYRDKLRRCGFEFQVVAGSTDTVQFTAVPACMLPRALVTHALAADAVEANGAQLIGRDGPSDSGADKMAPTPQARELPSDGNAMMRAHLPLPSDYWTKWRGYRRSQIHGVVTYVCEQLRSCRTVSELPPPLLRVLHTHACRGAIRFGTGLRRSQCVSLLRALSRCRLPFQCAHGRPSLAPLLLLTPPPPRDRVDLTKLRDRRTTPEDTALQRSRPLQQVGIAAERSKSLNRCAGFRVT